MTVDLFRVLEPDVAFGHEGDLRRALRSAGLGLELRCGARDISTMSSAVTGRYTHVELAGLPLGVICDDLRRDLMLRGPGRAV